MPDPAPTTGALARRGFTDPQAAQSALRALPTDLRDPLTAAASAAAEPDLALAGVARLLDHGRATPGAPHSAEATGELVEALRRDDRLRSRLLLLLGASAAMADFYVTAPLAWRPLAGPGPAADLPAWIEAAQAKLLATVDSDRASDALRVAYRGLTADLATADLAGELSFADTAAALSDLAVGVLRAGVRIATDRLGTGSTAGARAGADQVRLGIVALGKCGGRELNYVSDVDVVFVAGAADAVSAASAAGAAGGADEAALRRAAALAARTMRVCAAHTAAGTIWQVDAALRPEGGAGPLVRTVESYRSYYQRWAKTWEFQAMLKARPAAGDLSLAGELVDELTPMVWRAADRPHFVEDAQAMRRRVIEQLGHDPEREIKLGPGGLRDVEFAVQLLQLVHGRTDESLRSPTTLTALAALTAGGYIGRSDGAALARAYQFLRSLEHRLQLYRLQRTHTLPTDERALRRLGRSLGFTADPVAELGQAWSQTARTVRRVHEKLFYRPLLAAVARIPGEQVRLTPQAAEQRLTALGFGDPAAAMRHIGALTEGVSRRSAIQRQLLPVMLGWFADGPNPDAGLLAFRKVSDSLGATPWYLRLLRDEGLAAQRLATVLASSRYATAMFERTPEAVELLGRPDLAAIDRDAVQQEMRAAAGRQADDPDAAIASVRAVRRRHLLSVAVADLTEQLGLEHVATSLTAITDATLTVGMEVAARAVAQRTGQQPPGELAVIAMGRLGGAEVGYGSDADVMFVAQPAEGVAVEPTLDWGIAVATELRRLLAAPMADLALQVDADLRPEGRSGPLVRTLDSYAGYYARWSSAWEAQALLRARPLQPEAAVAAEFVGLIDPLRYPPNGLAETDVREIRRLKARIDVERLPRGADRATHTKLGRGGLVDVEWTVQLLQMRHAHRYPQLRTTSTLAALRAAADVGVLADADAAALVQAWELASRTRNAIMLGRGRPSDSLPSSPVELAAVAQLLGFTDSAEFVEHYRRLTRRAHGVVERVFLAPG